MTNIIESLKELEPRSMHHPLPIEWKKAKNDIIIDTKGNKYIDFTSTIFVMNVGHSNPKVKKHLKKAINKNLLHTYTFAHELREKFLRKLIDFTPEYLNKAFLLSSGTEATETAIRLMRMYTSKKKIISFEGCMHGRTMGAELMKGNGAYYNNHKDFVHLFFPNEDSVFKHDIHNLNINTSKIAGIMIETYQGWSARFLPKKYVQDLCIWAKENNILVTFDEVQSGFYRTGKLFGYQHYEVEPDLVCIGKAIGGGLPLSGVLGKKDIMDIPDVGDMSSTHSANPLCCAAGLGVLENLEMLKKYDNLFYNNCLVFEDFFNGFKQYENIVKDVHYKGFVGSIIFKDKDIANCICHRCLKNGLLLVHTGRESVKIGPPLTITSKNIFNGFKILDEAIKHFNFLEELDYD